MRRLSLLILLGLGLLLQAETTSAKAVGEVWDDITISNIDFPFQSMDTCDAEVLNAGEICCNSSGCGPLYDPGLIFETQAPSGGSGNYVYMWLISELMFDINGVPFWTTPEPIFNMDGTLYSGREYNPGPLNVSTRFRRCVTTQECLDAGFEFQIETNVVQITVIDCNCRPLDGGEIGDDQQMCVDGFDPDTLISLSNARPADPNDPIIYRWYFALSNVPFDISGNDWRLIVGANDPFYDPPFTDRDIYYIRMAFNPNCRTDFRLSNIVFIDVGGDIRVFPAATQPLCHDTEDGSIKLNINSSNDPFNIMWSNGLPDTICVGDLGPGIYRYTVTDALGCMGEGQVEITAPDSIKIDATITMNLCEGVSDGAIELDISGGTPRYTFEWDNMITDQDLIDIPNGEYCVTVTDMNGCMAEDCFIVSSKDTLLLNADIDSVQCFGECNGSILVNVNGGEWPYMYEWSDGFAGERRDSLKAGEYCVTVTAMNGCMLDTCLTVYQPDSLIVTGSVTDNECYGGCTGRIDVAVNGGTPPFSFDWDPDYPNTPNLDSLKAGEYCVTVTDFKGCMDSICFVVEEGDSIIVDIADTLWKCPGDIIDLNPNGSPDYEYEWSPADLVSNSTADNPTTCPENDTCIFVRVEDPVTGCFVERKIVIIVQDFPDFELPDFYIACDTIIEVCLDDFPDYDIDWSCFFDFRDTLPNDTCVFIEVLGKDTIYFRATDSLSCVFEQPIPIDFEVIHVRYADTIRFCEDDTIKVLIEDVYGNIDDWSYACDEFIVDDNGDGCIFLSYDRDTIVECFFTVSNDFCSKQFSFLIIVDENLHTVEASADPEKVNKGEMAKLIADSPNDNDTYTWSPDIYMLDNPNQMMVEVEPEESITYYVFSEDELGCNAIDSVFLEYTCLCEEPYIYVPNAFTPNGDNLNDTYNIVMEEELLEDYELSIYNRWGRLVFSTDDLNIDWDGTYNGTLVNTDVYAYILRVKCVGNDEEFTKYGNVTVLY